MRRKTRHGDQNYTAEQAPSHKCSTQSSNNKKNNIPSIHKIQLLGEVSAQLKEFVTPSKESVTWFHLLQDTPNTLVLSYTQLTSLFKIIHNDYNK